MIIDLTQRIVLLSTLLCSLVFATAYAKSTHHHKSPSKTGVIVGGTVGAAGAITTIGGAAKVSQSMSEASQKAKKAKDLLDAMEELGSTLR